MSSSVTVHDHLMRQIGSPNGWDPMPPDQYMCFLDEDMRLSDRGQRALAWLRWKTLRAKRGGRTPYAKDERGELGLKHLAADLNWPISTASYVWDELAGCGLARRDAETGRLYLCGKVERNQREKKGEQNFGQNNLPKRLLSFFQSLPENQRAQYLHGYLQLLEWGKQAEAEARRQAREVAQQLEDRYLASIGFVGEESRGRPKVAHTEPALLQLSLLRPPEIFFGQNNQNGNFGQNANEDVAKNQNAGGQISASLFSSENTENQRVSGAALAVEKTAPPDPPRAPSPPATPLTPNPSCLGKGAIEDPLCDEDPIVDCVQHFFGRKLGSGDPLRAKFQLLAAQFAIPARSVWRFLVEKLDRKRTQRYPIHSPGALYDMVTADLPGWIRQHPREVEADRQRAQQQQQAIPPPEEEAFDIEAFYAQMRRLTATEGQP